jgi:hypothetical protein
MSTAFDPPPEPLMLPMQDLVPILIRHNKLKSGWYSLTTTFQISILNFGPNTPNGIAGSEVPHPGAFAQVTQVGLQEVPANSPFAVNAADIN